ncbi:uncharacterized protein LOC144943556 [Lampetra fluviatilis]
MRALANDVRSLRSPRWKTGHAFLAERGHLRWSPPYLACDAGRLRPGWLLTVTAAFYGLTPELTPEFKGGIRLDLDLQAVDVDQCASRGGWFSGTHSCPANSTQCVPLKGLGFRLEGYECVCLPGFYRPNHTARDGPARGPCLRCGPSCCATRSGRCVTPRAARPLRLALLLVQLGAMGLALAAMPLTYSLRERKSIRSSGVVLLEVILFGAFLLYFPVFIVFFEPSAFRCILLRWVRVLGFCIVYGTIALKMCRLLEVFVERVSERPRPGCPWAGVARRLAALLLPPAWFLAAWTLAAWENLARELPLVGRGHTANGGPFLTCLLDGWDLMLGLAELLLTVWSLHLCRAARRVPSAFHEPSFLALALCNEALVSLAFHVTRFWLSASLHPDWTFIMFFVHSQLTVTVTLALLLLPKLCRAEGPRRNEAGDGEVYEDQLDGLGRSTSSCLNGSVASLGWWDHLDAEELTSELKRLYTQLELYRCERMSLGNPHLPRRRPPSRRGLARSFMRRFADCGPEGPREGPGAPGGGRQAGGGPEVGAAWSRVREATFRQKVLSLARSTSAYDQLLENSENSVSSLGGERGLEGGLLGPEALPPGPEALPLGPKALPPGPEALPQKQQQQQPGSRSSGEAEPPDSPPVLCRSASAHALRGSAGPMAPARPPLTSRTPPLPLLKSLSLVGPRQAGALARVATGTMVRAQEAAAEGRLGPPGGGTETEVVPGAGRSVGKWKPGGADRSMGIEMQEREIKDEVVMMREWEIEVNEKLKIEVELKRKKMQGELTRKVELEERVTEREMQLKKEIELQPRKEMEEKIRRTLEMKEMELSREMELKVVELKERERDLKLKKNVEEVELQELELKGEVNDVEMKDAELKEEMDGGVGRLQSGAAEARGKDEVGRGGEEEAHDFRVMVSCDKEMGDEVRAIVDEETGPAREEDTEENTKQKMRPEEVKVKGIGVDSSSEKISRSLDDVKDAVSDIKEKANVGKNVARAEEVRPGTIEELAKDEEDETRVQNEQVGKSEDHAAVQENQVGINQDITQDQSGLREDQAAFGDERAGISDPVPEEAKYQAEVILAGPSKQSPGVIPDGVGAAATETCNTPQGRSRGREQPTGSGRPLRDPPEGEAKQKRAERRSRNPVERTDGKAAGKSEARADAKGKTERARGREEGHTRKKSPGSQAGMAAMGRSRARHDMERAKQELRRLHEELSSRRGQHQSRPPLAQATTTHGGEVLGGGLRVAGQPGEGGGKGSLEVKEEATEGSLEMKGETIDNNLVSTEEAMEGNSAAAGDGKEDSPASKEGAIVGSLIVKDQQPLALGGEGQEVASPLQDLSKHEETGPQGPQGDQGNRLLEVSGPRRPGVHRQGGPARLVKQHSFFQTDSTEIGPPATDEGEPGHVVATGEPLQALPNLPCLIVAHKKPLSRPPAIPVRSSSLHAEIVKLSAPPVAPLLLPMDEGSKAEDGAELGAGGRMGSAKWQDEGACTAVATGSAAVRGHGEAEGATGSGGDDKASRKAAEVCPWEATSVQGGGTVSPKDSNKKSGDLPGSGLQPASHVAEVFPLETVATESSISRKVTKERVSLRSHISYVCPWETGDGDTLSGKIGTEDLEKLSNVCPWESVSGKSARNKVATKQGSIMSRNPPNVCPWEATTDQDCMTASMKGSGKNSEKLASVCRWEADGGKMKGGRITLKDSGKTSENRGAVCPWETESGNVSSKTISSKRSGKSSEKLASVCPWETEGGETESGRISAKESDKSSEKLASVCPWEAEGGETEGFKISTKESDESNEKLASVCHWEAEGGDTEGGKISTKESDKSSEKLASVCHWEAEGADTEGGKISTKESGESSEKLASVCPWEAEGGDTEGGKISTKESGKSSEKLASVCPWEAEGGETESGRISTKKSGENSEKLASVCPWEAEGGETESGRISTKKSGQSSEKLASVCPWEAEGGETESGRISTKKSGESSEKLASVCPWEAEGGDTGSGRISTKKSGESSEKLASVCPWEAEGGDTEGGKISTKESGKSSEKLASVCPWEAEGGDTEGGKISTKESDESSEKLASVCPWEAEAGETEGGKISTKESGESSEKLASVCPWEAEGGDTEGGKISTKESGQSSEKLASVCPWEAEGGDTGSGRISTKKSGESSEKLASVCPWEAEGGDTGSGRISTKKSGESSEKLASVCPWEAEGGDTGSGRISTKKSGESSEKLASVCPWEAEGGEIEGGRISTKESDKSSEKLASVCPWEAEAGETEGGKISTKESGESSEKLASVCPWEAEGGDTEGGRISTK